MFFVTTCHQRAAVEQGYYGVITVLTAPGLRPLSRLSPPGSWCGLLQVRAKAGQ